MSINAEINPSTRIVAKHVTMHNVSQGDVGLSNVDNTSDLDKPISTLTQAALDSKADISTTYTKTEVDIEIANLVNSAPENLDTLNELAQALNNDDDFASTITAQVAARAVRANNLEDLTDFAAARSNLELGASNDVTFNKVTTTSDLTVGTDLTIGGDLTIPGKIIHKDDSDTFIDFEDNDNIRIKSGGNDAIFIDSDGKVGIATNPSHKLHVKSPGTIGENPENLDNATIRVENDTANLYIDGNEVVSDHNLYLQTTLNDGFISLAADDGAGTRVNIANASADGFAIGKGDTTKATKPLDVTGDAIFRGKGTFGVNGDVTDAEAQPSITLFKPKAAAGIRQTRLTIGTNNDEAAFEIQTFDANNTFISNDYRIEKNASGADKHEFSIGNSPKLEITSDGIGIDKTPERTLDMDGHFRLLISPENRISGQDQVLIKSTNGVAAKFRVEGPATITHDLFKISGVSNGFADNSNHFHTVQKINRITQYVEANPTSEVANIERVQEQYYAIQNNNLRSSNAAFWNWHRVSRSIDNTNVSLTDLSGWDIQNIQDSSNRSDGGEVPFTQTEDTTFTFNTTNPFVEDDLLQITIDIDFEGAIVAATLFAKVTAVNGLQATVVLYGGNYKSTGQVDKSTEALPTPGNLDPQNAISTNFKVKKIDTTNKLTLTGNIGLNASPSHQRRFKNLVGDHETRTGKRVVRLTLDSGHGLELNDVITIITNGSGNYKNAEVAFVKGITTGSNSDQVYVVYGRIFDSDPNLPNDYSRQNIVAILKGTLDGLHKINAGDTLMHFNSDNAGRYKSFHIGPGTEVDGNCISIGKNVYNNIDKSVRIGYEPDTGTPGITTNHLLITPTYTETLKPLSTTGVQAVRVNRENTNQSDLTYDAAIHRFRDFDETPNDMLVIRKATDPTTGAFKAKAFVGINTDTPDTPLHILGESVRDDGLVFKAIGGGLFSSKNKIALHLKVDSDNDTTGAPILKLQQDNDTNTGLHVERMNLGFIGFGGGGIYTNSTADAAYIEVENNRTFEISTGGQKSLSIDSSGNVTIPGNITIDGNITGSLTIADSDIPSTITRDSELNAFTGSSSITTVGTIGTGTWQGTQIANAYIADLPTSKITSGTFADSTISSSSVTQHQGDLSIATSQLTGDVTGKIITNEIQCEGTTSGTAQPIRYDAREHRFRDFNETPSDLMVIKMIAGEGGRVGINTDDPKATLHVVGEGSSGFQSDEAIRCVGGLRISNWLRLGAYTDSERDALGSDPPQGLVIYNEDNDQFEGFVANPSGSGSGSWKSFVNASLDGSIPDANITESSVTQHQAALSIDASQITGGEINISEIPDTIARTADLTAHTSSTSNPHNVTREQLNIDTTDNVTFSGVSLTTGSVSTTPSSDNDLANKKYVDDEVAGIVNGAPAALDTLNELAAALGDNENFATNTATSIGEKLAKASNLEDLQDAVTARANLGLDQVENKSSASIRSEIVDGDIPNTITRDSELSAHTNSTLNPHSVTKAQVGLSDVDNESKASMFNNPTFTGDVTRPVQNDETDDSLDASSAPIRNIRNMTQLNYNNLNTKDANTLYIIVG